MTPRARAAALTAAYYAALFGALGAQLPYWPVWLADWGLTPAEIGVFTGWAVLVRIAGATAIPAIADRFALRRAIICLGALGVVAASVWVMFVETKAMLLAVTLVAAVVMAPTIPLGEALGLRAAGKHGFAYAPVRAAGSVAFLAANVAVGAWIGSLGPDLVLWVIIAGFAVLAVLGAIHPGGGAAPGQLTDRAAPGELLALVRTPVFLAFIAATAFGQSAHMAYYVYSVLDWQAQGIDGAVIGWLWAVGVIAETALMLGPGRSWVARFGAAGALRVAAIAGLVRWAAMAAGPDAALLWPVQMLHALTFALGHLGAMAFIAAAIPARMSASAQGLASGIGGGALSAGATFAAAWLAGQWGIGAAYWLAAGMAGGSLISAWMLGRAWRGEMLAAP